MKISVVTISYNQAPFLRDAIESVLGQNYEDLEYIIIDAGSNDDSRKIICEYEEKLSHIIFEPDKGPADGLNKGLALCTGDIFCYLNADDRFSAGAFLFVEQFFRTNNNVDVLLGSTAIIDVNGKRKWRRRIPSDFNATKYLEGTTLALQQATFIRHKVLKDVVKFNVDNFTCWDGELLVDTLINGARFTSSNKVLGEFRIYPGSITGSGTNKERYLGDRKRISNKLFNAGYRLGKNFRLRRLLIRLNLIRVIKEFIY
ncbi:glycosyltransferase family 2 protein [Pedobacter sp. MC2016-05]|uniref:glycosyltransferase family 2 protein n=1 Tax=Pedobacter sp. MC2016-05 TaxID=2994474 RepID=UPI002246BCDD|nr:glycosyltransferase family 2 protein [Pedobacter sp. MC2016-05]MCX2473231.1 glycosyltransferase family 2 protein [Pedobacter sp. MC2016-05]